MDKRAERKALEQLRALFKAEGVDFDDVDAALVCIAGTVLPTKLTKVYLAEIERVKK